MSDAQVVVLDLKPVQHVRPDLRNAVVDYVKACRAVNQSPTAAAVFQAAEESLATVRRICLELT